MGVSRFLLETFVFSQYLLLSSNKNLITSNSSLVKEHFSWLQWCFTGLCLRRQQNSCKQWKPSPHGLTKVHFLAASSISSPKNFSDFLGKRTDLGPFILLGHLHLSWCWEWKCFVSRYYVVFRDPDGLCLCKTFWWCAYSKFLFFY